MGSIIVPFLKEDVLKATYDLQKVCDYLVDGNVLIECKAIDISPTAGIKRTKKILQNEYDKTATKAYKQILSTASGLNTDVSLYGVVITFKERLIGFGEDAWEEFLDEPITEYAKEENIKINLTVPPERLVFITLEDWDRLVQAKLQTKKTISELLAAGFKSHREGQSLFFDQTLADLVDKVSPAKVSYLEEVRPVFQKTN